MSKIKVYVRVRPPLPGEFDTPGCFNCTELEDVSGNWIRIKKEGEQTRYFARVWGPQSTQEEMFRTVGINTVNDVFEGYYGCIFVYGQTGTGKTFTLGCLTPGLEGIQPRCIKYLFDKIAKEANKYEVTVKQHYVQLYREYVQDLLDITKDNLKIRMDEATGATIEKVTVRDVTSYEQCITLIQEGDSNRVVANTKMNSASSRSHACLITEIWRKNKETGAETFGRLYLIDLAGSERASKSGVTDEAFKEMVSINKSLTTLGNCIAGLVNGEKVVSFRDSPLTRILQHSLTGHGRTSIIVTTRPDSPNMQETICTLKFGERAQKVEAQMTPAGYRDNVVEAEEKIRDVWKPNAANAQLSFWYKKWASSIQASIAGKEQELRAKEEETNKSIAALQAEHGLTKQKMEDDWHVQEESITATNMDELKRLRTENASVIKEIDDKVAAEEQKARAKNAEELQAIEAEIATVNSQIDSTRRDFDALEREVGAEDPHLKAARLIEEHTAAIEAARRKLRGCRTSKYEGYTLGEIDSKLHTLRSLREHLEARKEESLEKTEDWDAKAMKKFKEKRYIKPSDAEQEAFMTAETSKMLTAAAAEKSDSEAPPSEEAPPSSSDDSDSSSGSSSDSDDTTSSDSDADANKKAKAPTNVLADTLTAAKAAAETAALQKRPCKKMLFSALEKDTKLAEILEGIVTYLDNGTVVYVLRKDKTSDKDKKDKKDKDKEKDKDDDKDKEKGKSKPKQNMIISKEFMYVGPNRETIVLCEVQENNPSKGNKLKTIETFKITDIKNACLGQYSEGFKRALDLAPLIPHGTVTPKTSEKCSIASLGVFFRRSISLLSALSGDSVLDVVFNTDSDFEAWIVSFHRFTNKDPIWGGPMDVDTEDGVKELTEAERTLCINKHVPPRALLKTKKVLMEAKRANIYLTLYDFRAASGLDLIHAQRIFIFFIEEHYIKRHPLYHIRYTELIEESNRRDKEREALRGVRIRLVNMVRYYKKATFAQIQNFLKAAQGKEQALLDRLLTDLGPEPTEAQLATLLQKAPSTAPNAAAAVDEVTQEIEAAKEPTKEELEILEEEQKAKEEAQRISEAQKKLEAEVNAAIAEREKGEGEPEANTNGTLDPNIMNALQSPTASPKLGPSPNPPIDDGAQPNGAEPPVAPREEHIDPQNS